MKNSSLLWGKNEGWKSKWIDELNLFNIPLSSFDEWMNRRLNGQQFSNVFFSSHHEFDTVYPVPILDLVSQWKNLLSIFRCALTSGVQTDRGPIVKNSHEFNLLLWAILVDFQTNSAGFHMFSPREHFI